MSKSVTITNSTKKESGILGLFFVFALFFIPTSTQAASYVFSPSSGSYKVGDTVTVKLLINTEGKSIIGITGGGALTYDSATLSFQSASFVDFNLPVAEPTLSGGKITFEGGKIGSASGNVTVLTAVFKAKAEGSATVSLTNPQVLQAGSSILTGSPPTGTYTITAASKPEPVESIEPVEEERNTKIPPPEAPVIKSATHPEQGEWYAVKDAKFNWDIPYGVIALRLGFSSDEHGTTTENHKPPIGEWSTAGVADGVWYLRVEFENRGGWGSSTAYAIHVDTTPPEDFTIAASGGDLTAELRFEAVDALSGISHYEVTVDGERPRDVQPTELTDGYRLTNMDPGEHSILVKAYDKAGNDVTAETSVVVTGTKEVEEEEVKTSGFGAIYWVSLLFMAALAATITMLVKERRRNTEEKDHIKRETMEVGERLINIFGVLRDEIEEKVVELSHKPNMTDNERNILEGLKDALDISEELIDKEVEDVRKLLK